MNLLSNGLALNSDRAAMRANLSLRPATAEAQTGTPFFAQVLSVAQRRKWVLIVAIIGTLLVGIVLTMLMTPKFTASNTIEIQREGTTFSAVEGGAQPKASSTDNEFYETQYGMLKAISLGERIARDLRLYDNVHFFTISGSSKPWIVDGRITADAPSREERIHIAGLTLLTNMKVVSQRQSRLVNLSYTSPDPVLAKQVVDAWARAFIQATLDRRYEASSYARRFLESRLKQLRERIDSSERQLVSYARAQKIVNIPAPQTASGTSSGDRPLIAENLSAINTELAAATADRVRAQSRLAISGNATVEVVQSQAINALRQQRTELAATYAKLMAQFEPGFPQAQAVQNQINQVDRAITREEGRVASSVRGNYEAALEREQNLQARVDALKTGVLDFRQRSIQYNIYQRDADTNRQLYDALLQRYKEIGVAGGVGVNNISIVDDAELPVAPSSPNWLLNLTVSLLLGAIIGAGAVALLEQLDQGISDPKVVEDALGLPLLGTIPLTDTDNIVSTLSDPKSPLYESYLSLRTTLGFTTEHGLPKTISVTSTRPAEGKSTTSFALACSISRGGARTLLLDGDMRSPSVHHELHIANDIGLSNFLSGNDDLDAMMKETSFTGLSVMTAGPQPPSAAELLSSERMPLLLQRLLQSYDHIVIDAPPIMGLADAPIIGSMVEGVVFVIESHATDKGTVLVAIERMRAASVNLLGAVLTKFNVKRAHYGYGYSYGYGYGYGSDTDD